MNGEQELTAKIEATYREHRGVFLAGAKKAARNAMDAEDILQDVFLKVLDNANVLDAVANLPAWIFRGIRNRVIDLWRHKKVRAKSGETDVSEETISEIVAASGFDPADLAVRHELADALSEAIDALNPEQRAVIEAQVFDGITFQELSERTGLPVNTLMTRKRLAVKKLAAALREWIAD